VRLPGKSDDQSVATELGDLMQTGDLWRGSTLLHGRRLGLVVRQHKAVSLISQVQILKDGIDALSGLTERGLAFAQTVEPRISLSA
jgi:hypothetical protein